MFVLSLALRSLWNRRLTSCLTILSVVVSVTLLLGVERVRQGAQYSFANTISQTDLIVGARGGSLQLLLYAVFRIGNPTNNISYDTYREFKNHPAVDWTIPLSLGDSHRGFKVVGTNENFYRYYRFHGDRQVSFREGKMPEQLLEVVLGNDVARRFNYELGSKIVLAHGVVEHSLQHHDDRPFRVVGILDQTGTPLDRSLYISLEAMEALHLDWHDGAPPIPGEEIPLDELLGKDIAVGQITAFLLRTKNRFETLRLQRDINQYPYEAMMAIIPGVVLSELWQALAYAEAGLRIVSMFVVVVGLMGLLVSLYNSLNERRREMAILRSVGAGPLLILLLLVLESMMITITGVVLGVLSMYGLLFFFQPYLVSEFGIYIAIQGLSSTDWIFIVSIIILGFLMGVVPALRAYFNTLHDGLTPTL